MELTDEAQDLAMLMSAISEEAYCAGWMSGLEYDLWRIVLAGPQGYGQSDVTEQHIRRLRKLSERCGGWICFDDESGEIFLPLKEWEDLYESKMATLGMPMSN